MNKWVNLFTHYLSNKVVSTMDDLYTFIAASGKVLETADPANSELDQAAAQRSLYEVMATMRDIRKRTDKTDNMFDPLRQTVTLLKNYGAPPRPARGRLSLALLSLLRHHLHAPSCVQNGTEQPHSSSHPTLFFSPLLSQAS